jgi:hypothetical protein
MEVAWVWVHKRIRTRAFVAKFDEPKRSRVAHDRATDFFTDLADQRVEYGFPSLSMSARQDVRTVLFENEDRPVGPSEDRARRHDELKRRLLIGEKAREEEPGHSPDDIPGGNRGEVVYFGQ